VCPRAYFRQVSFMVNQNTLRMNKLSSTQYYIWLDQQINQDSIMYNLGGYAIISGDLHVENFYRALSLLLESQEIFSFSFSDQDGTPVYTRNTVKNNLLYYDFSEYSDDYIHDWIEKDFQQPFDLNSFPLYKFALLKQAGDKHLWYAKIHHILADGASFRLLFNQVEKYYRDISAGLDPVAVQYEYAPYIDENNKYRTSAAFAADKEYWLEKFRVQPEFVFHKSAQEEASFFTRELTVSASAKQQLCALAASAGVSLFSVFAGIIAVYASRYKRNCGMVFGVPVMNRSSACRDVIGLFMGMMPVQLRFHPEQDFVSFLKYIKKEMLLSLRHHHFQQADILSSIDRKPAYNRFYDIRISYEAFKYNVNDDGYSAEIITLPNGMETDPVSIHIMDYEDGDIKVRFDFNGGFIREAEAESFVAAFEHCVHSAGSWVGMKLALVPVLPKECHERVADFSQGGRRPAAAHTTFADSWDAMLGQYGNSTAVSFNGQSLTYAEIDDRSDAVAQALREKAIAPGDTVALYLDRSPAVIISMLAIMKCGAVVVALEKDYPVSRLSYILTDCSCNFCITDEASADLLKEITTIDFEQALTTFTGGNFVSSKVESNAPAYIIYTSGSTGKPKGVVISHKAMFDYVLTFADYFRVTAGDVVLQQSSFSFDTSIEEVFPVLYAGGRLVIAAYKNDIAYLLQLMQHEGITILSTNPYVVEFLNNAFRADLWPRLRTVISGGDVLKPEYVTNLVGVLDVYNTYGPTEATVCTTFYKVLSGDTLNIPIGKPVTNKNVYIVDDFGGLQPVGIAGEICIAGNGLALHYLNLPLQTGIAFTTIPSVDERVYKTGDLGIWLPDGNIAFAGRKDRQLSVNGYRIEPEEIEKCILSAEGVKGCIADTFSMSGHTAIVVYLLASKEEVKVIELKKLLSSLLPPSMMPSAFIFMDNFPMLQSGKPNRSKLAEALQFHDAEMSFEPAEGRVEEEVAAIWKKLLKLERVGRDNNFFELGGHSLIANQCVSFVREQFQIELSLKVFYNNPTVRLLADVIKGSSPQKEALTKITPAPEGALIPLSYPQERIWFLQQLYKDYKAYIVPRALKMKGKVNVDVMEDTFTRLIERHEILRTVFRMNGGVPYQHVLPPYTFTIKPVDFTSADTDEQAQLVSQFIYEEGNRKFDLENGPLLRAYMLSLSKQESILVVCEHHLIHDGWTQGVLLNEFIQLYSALIRNQPSPLPELSIQFGDFAYWQRNTYTVEALKEVLAYWEKQLKNVTPELNLPTYQPRPLISTGNGALEEMHVPKAVQAKLTAYCRKNDVTLFMVMLGAFKVLLHKYSGNNDLCIATGVANRRIKEMDNMLGMIINTIALRTVIDTEENFTDLIRRIKQICLEGYENEDAPFSEVVYAVNPQRSLTALPLAQYMFSFMNTPTRNIELPDLNIEIVDSHNLSAKFDINIVVVIPRDDAFNEGAGAMHDDIIVEWEYNTDIFDKDTMQRMLSSYIRLMDSMLDNPDAKVGEMNILSPGEQEAILSFSDPYGIMGGAALNNISGNGLSKKQALQLFEQHSEKMLMQFIEEHAAGNPGAAAVSCNGVELTYMELNSRANRLGAYLREKYDVKADDLVCIKIERNEWMVIAMLAVLKAGGAYVPVDPGYPAERVDYIISDSNAKVMFDTEELGRFRHVAHLYPDENLVPVSGPENLAYVIYTSGSTGKPKGVMLEHRSMMSLFKSAATHFSLNKNVVFGAATNFTFDISVLELLGSLMFGMHYYLLPSDDTAIILDHINDGRVNGMQLTPSRLDQLLEATGNNMEVFKAMELIIVGGEALGYRAWEKLKDMNGTAKVFNGYGPTETTMWSTCMEIRSSPSLSIGKPMTGEYVLILGNNDTLSPAGVMGEICIGGSGLARGYLNNPELTSRSFTDNPLMPGERIYRTGDIGRWSADGNIEFAGRKDEQVKIRGYRIEPGEIEKALESHPDVETATVLAKPAPGGEAELAAYFTADSTLNASDLRKHLLQKLPQYMIPAYFIQLDTMPLTFSGKVDRKSLPDPYGFELKTGELYIAPRNEMEQALADIWTEVLGRVEIGIRDNFFDLGGHSLKATRIIAKIEDRLGIQIELKELFADPTIENLAAYINTIKWMNDEMEAIDNEGNEMIL
jgi:amino acid adenylation domain-containing protein